MAAAKGNQYAKGNHTPKNGCRYDLKQLKNEILDSYGGIPPFVKQLTRQEKIEFIRQFAAKEITVKHEGSLDLNINKPTASIMKILASLINDKAGNK
jgi:hypothetical protein